MCGLAGILSKDDRINDLRETVIRMRDALRHRGPDDVGIYACEGIALAHTRLSIIDIDGGHQPLKNEDETIYLIGKVKFTTISRCKKI